MSLQLYVEGAGHNERDVLENLPLEISASIVQEATQLTPRIPVCSASGTPNSRVERTRWVLMSSHAEAAFWNEACVDVPLNPANRYRIAISTRPLGSHVRVFRAVPTLEGGGNEFP